MPNWKEVLGEINAVKTAADADIKAADARKRAAVDEVRRAYLERLHAYTDRNIIAYYSGWLSKPDIQSQNIIDEDKNGFMMAVHQLDKAKGLDRVDERPS